MTTPTRLTLEAVRAVFEWPCRQWRSYQRGAFAWNQGWRFFALAWRRQSRKQCMKYVRYSNRYYNICHGRSPWYGSPHWARKARPAGSTGPFRKVEGA